LQGDILIGLARVHRALGAPDLARTALTQALAVIRPGVLRVLEGRVLTELAEILVELGRPAEAAPVAEQAHGIHTETGHRPGLDRTTHLLDRLAGR
jgi:hypothetical protein